MNFLYKLIDFYLKKKNVIRNKIIIFFYMLNLIPNKYHKRAENIKKVDEYSKKFKKLKLIYNKMGFYQLNPMPSKEFLNKYYAETYWDSRVDKNNPIKLRDIEHLKLLKKIYPDFSESPKKILNFGSGQGGISILLHLEKHEIYNIEPGMSSNIFDSRWHQVEDFSKLSASEKFDLIYSSHSLEHVQDIYETMKKFREISKENTIYFFEIPNCMQKKFQKIHAPHTYYFTKEFFLNSFENFDFCSSYNGLIKTNNGEGNILRFLSRSKMKEFHQK